MPDTPVTVRIFADKTIIKAGEPANLSWDITGIHSADDSVALSPSDGSCNLWAGSPPNHVETIPVHPVVNTTYTITAVRGRDGQTASASIRILIAADIAFTATPVNQLCGIWNLSWTVTSGNIAGVTVTIDNGIGTVNASGQQQVLITQNTTYTLTVVDESGTYTSQISLGMCAYTGGSSASPSLDIEVTSSNPTYWPGNIDAGQYVVEYVSGAWLWKPLPLYTPSNAPSYFQSNSYISTVPAWNTTLVQNSSGITGWQYQPALLSDTFQSYLGPSYYTFAVYDFGTVLNLKRVTVSYRGYSISGGYVYVSTDGVNWTSVYTLPGGTGEQQPQNVDHTFSPVVSCQYLAVRVNENGGSPANAIWNFKAYDETDAQLFASRNGTPLGPVNEGAGSPWTVGPITITNGSDESVSLGITGQPPYYSSAAGAQAGAQGAYAKLCHKGGALGAYVTDAGGDYADNAYSPKVRLVGPAPFVTISADTNRITAGSSVLLTWTSNAYSASIDNGPGSLNGSGGSVPVTPEITTTYTITGIRDGFSNAAASVVITVDPLQPPADIRAMASKNRQIHLTCAPPDSIHIAINVYRYMDNAFTLIGTASNGAYTDTPSQAFTDYTYAMTTVNNGSQSDLSDPVTAQTVDVPAQVTDAVLIPGSASLTITASAVAHADSYRCYISQVSQDSNPPIILNSPTSSFTLTDLYNTAATYYARVSAVNAYGEGTLSAECSAIPIYSERGNVWVNSHDVGI